MAITKEQIEAAVGAIIDVNTERELATTKSLKAVSVEGGKVSITIVLGYPASGYFAQLQQQVSEVVNALDGVDSVDVNVSSKIVSHAVQQNLIPS